MKSEEPLAAIGIETSDIEDEVARNAEWEPFESGIDASGIVEDLEVETFYARLESLVSTDTCLRVVADNGFTDIETRIPYSTLNELGWQFVGLPERGRGIPVGDTRE